MLQQIQQNRNKSYARNNIFFNSVWFSALSFISFTIKNFNVYKYAVSDDHCK
jgi:hypothetical protein